MKPLELLLFGVMLALVVFGGYHINVTNPDIVEFANTPVEYHYILLGVFIGVLISLLVTTKKLKISMWTALGISGILLLVGFALLSAGP